MSPSVTLQVFILLFIDPTPFESNLITLLYLPPNAEVRQEAVQQALAALKNRPKPSLPMPSKRSSVLNRSPDRVDDDDDDDSGVYPLLHALPNSARS